MDAQKEERRLLEIDLGTALEKSEFELYYQPQVVIQGYFYSTVSI